MSPIHLDDRAALVLIDIQKGILRLPTAVPADDIKKRCMRLAQAFHARDLPVVRVAVGWSPDGGDLPRTRTLTPGPVAPPPAEFTEFPDDFVPAPQDIVITKRHWGAFTGTELDLQLRRRGVTQIVLAGISTSIGVESTARSAWEHSYNLLFVQDAMSDPDTASHAHSLAKIFPRLGEIADTDQVLSLLSSSS
jgi:nicotinamidase-related amidase